MEGPYQERWQQLCKLVAEEKDPVRFSQLVQELLEELHNKEERLKGPSKGSPSRPLDTKTLDSKRLDTD